MADNGWSYTSSSASARRFTRLLGGGITYLSYPGKAVCHHSGASLSRIALFRARQQTWVRNQRLGTPLGLWNHSRRQLQTFLIRSSTIIARMSLASTQV